MLEDLDVLKVLFRVGMSIDREKYGKLLGSVLYRLRIPVVECEVDPDTTVMEEWLRRKYRLGGSRLRDGVEVLRVTKKPMVSEMVKQLGREVVE